MEPCAVAANKGFDVRTIFFSGFLAVQRVQIIHLPPTPSPSVDLPSPLVEGLPQIHNSMNTKGHLISHKVICLFKVSTEPVTKNVTKWKYLFVI